MKTEAEIQQAILSFESAVSLRLHQVESLDANDRFYLVKLSRLQKEIKELELKIEGLKWTLKNS